MTLAIFGDHGKTELLSLKRTEEGGSSLSRAPKIVRHSWTTRSISMATSYRILHRLEERHLLEAYWEEDDSPAHQGPRRRYYKAMPLAERALRSFAEGQRNYLKRLGLPGWGSASWSS